MLEWCPRIRCDYPVSSFTAVIQSKLQPWRAYSVDPKFIVSLKGRNVLKSGPVEGRCNQKWELANFPVQFWADIPLVACNVQTVVIVARVRKPRMIYRP
jgi:hypothetical protein